MALITKGDGGEPREARVGVLLPKRGDDGLYRVRDDVTINCAEGDHAKGVPGVPPIMMIRMTHDEALQLCAGLAMRLAMRPGSSLVSATQS